MPHFSDTRQLPYTPRQLFDLVWDMESYPKFLPWCIGARVLKREGEIAYTELVIRFKAFTERYTSKVTPHPPTEQQPEGRIVTRMVEGPFEHLANDWHFTPDGKGGCILTFEVDFRFRSRILEGLMGALFARATQKMTSAFEDRAKELYGSGPSASA